MPATPFDWNAVVVGAWNPAILTPDGIARRLFGLEPGVPLEVQVPLDASGVIKVVYDGLIAVPSSQRLTVQAQEPTRDGIVRAAAAASRAIGSLPETPLTAAGVNVRYRFDELPDGLLQDLVSPADDRLADADFRVLGRILKRTLNWQDGVVNLEIHWSDDSSGAFLLNFHRPSKAPNELQDWLAQADDMVTAAETLFHDTFHLVMAETDNE